MKKILLAVLALTFVSSLCFARQASSALFSKPKASAPVSEPTQASAETKTLTGTVNSVTAGGLVGALVVTDDKGQRLNFVVESGTPINTGKDTNAVPLGDIRANTKVTVEYTTKAGGINKARSINLLEFTNN